MIALPVATAFTPWSALAGGVLVGLAATLMMAMLGRVAGVSGILNHAIESPAERGWRVAFLVSLVAGAGLWMVLAPGATPQPRADFPLQWLVAAGLLVGFGTRLGNGCTSGHGICGLARLSPRSLVAVVVFMASAAITVFVTRHASGVFA